jgi:hypothetical protein
VFGSYVTAKADPNDVDIILIMDDNFRLEACPVESRGLFDHAVAQARYGASVFWTRCVIGVTMSARGQANRRQCRSRLFRPARPVQFGCGRGPCQISRGRAR